MMKTRSSKNKNKKFNSFFQVSQNNPTKKRVEEVLFNTQNLVKNQKNRLKYINDSIDKIEIVQQDR